jgi:hypothetical protein
LEEAVESLLAFQFVLGNLVDNAVPVLCLATLRFARWIVVTTLLNLLREAEINQSASQRIDAFGMLNLFK